MGEEEWEFCFAYLHSFPIVLLHFGATIKKIKSYLDTRTAILQ